jgi:hypothetical protein
MATTKALPPLAAKLLLGIDRELARLKKIDLRKQPPAGDRAAAGVLREAVRDAGANVLRLDLELWLADGPLDTAARRRAQRALNLLVDGGLLERIGTEARTTHVRLLEPAE